VRQVDISTQAGSFGIVAQHVPTIGTLKPGVLEVFNIDGTVKKYFGKSKPSILFLIFYLSTLLFHNGNI